MSLQARPLSLFAIPALLAVAAGCGGTDPADPGAASLIEAELGPEGGSLEGGPGLLDGVRVEVPAGALAEPTWVSLSAAEGLNPLPDGGVAVGPQVRLGPDHLELASPATVRLPFSGYQVQAAGSDTRMVKVWYVGPEGWELMPPEDRGVWWVSVALDGPTALGAGLGR